MSSVSDGLHRVSYGLKLVYLSLVLPIVTFVGFVCLLVTQMKPGEKNPLPNLFELTGPISVVVYLLIFLILMSGVIGIMGKIFCLQVPEAARATGTIFLSLAFSAIGLLIQVTAQIPATARTVAPIAGLDSTFITLGYVTFLTFLQRMAEFIGDGRAAVRARGILLHSFLLVGVLFVGMTMIYADGSTSPVAILILAGVMIGMLVLFVRYLRLIGSLRRSVEFRLAEGFEGSEEG